MGRQKKALAKPATNTLPPKSWFARNNAILRFGLTFGVVTLLYYVVTLLPWIDGTLFPAYLEANARISNAILHWLGQATVATGATIRSPYFSVTIKRGCDALEPSWLFCAAVLAYPSFWRHRLPGMLAGVTVILSLNLVRIISLYYLGMHLPDLFETMHLEVWPVVFILTALLLWVAWITWIRKNTHKPTNAPI